MPSALRCVLFTLALTLCLFPSPTAAAPPCWLPPVEAWVVDPFREPPCPWCPGNRGIDFGVAGERQIRAVSAGVVTFAGTVAGTIYVVVEHVDGWKVTYGKLVHAAVRQGDVVSSRAVVGTVRSAYFLGLRVDGAYRDPWPYLGALRGRPRLVPVDGRPARPAPPARVVCGQGDVRPR